MAESTVSLYETGKREPDIITIRKLSEELNTTTDYLLGRSDDPASPSVKEQAVPGKEQPVFSGKQKMLLDLCSGIPDEKLDKVISILHAAIEAVR